MRRSLFPLATSCQLQTPRDLSYVEAHLLRLVPHEHSNWTIEGEEAEHRIGYK